MKKAGGETAGLAGPAMRKAMVILTSLMILAVVAIACSSSENEPPTAIAGEDAAVLAGYPVELDGSASSDPDGDEITYTWTLQSKPEGSEAELSNAAAISATFTPDAVGEYVIGLTVSDEDSSSPPASVSVSARPWFTKVTKEANVSGGKPQKYVDGYGPGAAWGDYDNDGNLDLYVTADGPNMLYRNEGNGTFREVAAEAGVDADCNSYGAAWGDYDNDGGLDLYVVCHSEDQEISLDHEAYEPNVLYKNNGDGTFVNVASEAGVDYVSHGTGASWGDYNKDGHLDLYVANFGIYGSSEGIGWADGNVLYLNNGDGTFTDVTEQAGVQGNVGRVTYTRAGGDIVKTGQTFTGLWFDFDNDGNPDLLECNDEGVSPLYRNNGDGTFSDVTKAAGLFLLGSCMGVDAGDYDRDGFLDVYLTNYDENYLWHNNGDGTFSEVAKQAGVADSLVGWATGFVDFDNDGLPDIYGVNGLTGPPMEETGSEWDKPLRESNFLYRNNGDGTFTDVTAMAGFGDASVGRGTAVGDYDNDGDLDFYVVNSDAPNILYRNEIGARNNWVKLRFEGDTTNRGGVGVRVRVDTGEWSLIEEVRSGSGFLSGNSPELLYGLGQMAIAKEITITWSSGAVQSMRDVPANQTITIRDAEAQ